MVVIKLINFIFIPWHYRKEKPFILHLWFRVGCGNVFITDDLG